MAPARATLFEMVTGSNAPTSGRGAGRRYRDIHAVKYRERDRLRDPLSSVLPGHGVFTKWVPSAFLAPSPTATPLVHLFDEPQFNLQDGYIGFMLDFFLQPQRRRAVWSSSCMHQNDRKLAPRTSSPRSPRQFLFVAGGGVEPPAGFSHHCRRAAFPRLSRPEMTRRPPTRFVRAA